MVVVVSQRSVGSGGSVGGGRSGSRRCRAAVVGVVAVSNVTSVCCGAKRQSLACLCDGGGVVVGLVVSRKDGISYVPLEGCGEVVA